MQLVEVIDQLKFLLFKSPVKQVTKMKGGSWEPVRKSDLKTPPAGVQVVKHAPPATPSSWSKTPSGTQPLPGSVSVTDKEMEKKWKKPSKWFSAGGVVVAGKDDYSKIYIRKPSNNYGPWSFPKGRIDKGESPPKTALREVEEEIGIRASLVPGGYLGTGEGDFSITHYYLMYAVQNLHRTDKETEKVELVSWSDAIHTFARAGNLRDLRITTRAMDLVEKLRKQGKVP